MSRIEIEEVEGVEPPRRARVEEQEQQPHHQREPHPAIAQEQFEPRRNLLRAGAQQVDLDPLGQGRADLIDDALHQALQGNRIALRCARDIDRHRRICADEISAVARGPLNTDLRHVAQPRAGLRDIGAARRNARSRGASLAITCVGLKKNTRLLLKALSTRALALPSAPRPTSTASRRLVRGFMG